MFKLKSLTAAFAVILLTGCALPPDETSLTSEASSKASTANQADGAPSTTQVATSDATKEDDDDRIICKRERVTGSRFAKKVCMSWREWKQMGENSRALVEGNQRASRFNTPDGGGR